MQFLLTAINAKYIHSNPAIYSLRAYAGEKLQPFISLAEYTINNRMEEILGDISKKHPDAIGFSCYIWNFRLIQELIPEIAKVLPGIDIWLGGPEVSFEAEKVLEEGVRAEDVPSHLRDSNRDKAKGDGIGYKYPHLYPGHYVEQQYLPSSLVGRRFYNSSDNGWEGKITKYKNSK